MFPLSSLEEHVDIQFSKGTTSSGTVSIVIFSGSPPLFSLVHVNNTSWYPAMWHVHIFEANELCCDREPTQSTCCCALSKTNTFTNINCKM